MSRSGRIDRELLDAIEALDPEEFSGKVWRTTWETREPLVGGDAGGRWHPQNSFEALYTSLDPNGSLTEVYYHLSRAPVVSSAEMRLFQLSVKTKRTLRLNKELLLKLGIDEAEFQSMNYTRSQEIGAAAYLLEFDSLLVPSARSQHANFILFLDRLDLNELRVSDESRVDWLNWKERKS